MARKRGVQRPSQAQSSRDGAFKFSIDLAGRLGAQPGGKSHAHLPSRAQEIKRGVQLRLNQVYKTSVLHRYLGIRRWANPTCCPDNGTPRLTLAHLPKGAAGASLNSKRHHPFRGQVFRILSKGCLNSTSCFVTSPLAPGLGGGGGRSWQVVSQPPRPPHKGGP